MTESRGSAIARRLEAVGISKAEFAAERASVDRGTLDRAIADDVKVSARTWSKIERALADLEEELSMAETGALVTSTIDYKGARVTVKGTPHDVAETVRHMLGEGAVGTGA